MNDQAAPTTTPGTEAPEPGLVEFTGQREPLARLIVANTLLTIFTLGIYRFWATTKMRRYYWGHIRVARNPLEYTGTGLELFLGFLIVLAFLFVIGLLFGIAELVTQALGPWAPLALNVVYAALILCLIQIAVYRMWRYRLSRTSWRGIRFGLDGSSRAYLGRALPWLGLTAVTLGLAYPWMRIALVRYRFKRTRYGSSHFDFEGTGRALFVPWLLLSLFSSIPMLAFLFYNADAFVAFSQMAQEGAEATPAEAFPFNPASFVLLMPLVAAPFLSVWYRVREWRHVVSCTRFGEATFEARPKTVGVIVIAIFTFIAVVGIVAVPTMITSFIAPPVAVGIVAAIFYVFGATLVVQLLFVFEVVGHFCRTLVVKNPAAFDAVVQSADRGPPRGEGLADAFDVGAF